MSEKLGKIREKNINRTNEIRIGISRGSYVTDGEVRGSNQRAVFKFKIWNRYRRLPLLDVSRQLQGYSFAILRSVNIGLELVRIFGGLS
jgi:hypothetical protein